MDLRATEGNFAWAQAPQLTKSKARGEGQTGQRRRSKAKGASCVAQAASRRPRRTSCALQAARCRLRAASCASCAQAGACAQAVCAQVLCARAVRVNGVGSYPLNHRRQSSEQGVRRVQARENVSMTQVGKCRVCDRWRARVASFLLGHKRHSYVPTMRRLQEHEGERPPNDAIIF